jgi:hypothetical protein
MTFYVKITWYLHHRGIRVTCVWSRLYMFQLTIYNLVRYWFRFICWILGWWLGFLSAWICRLLCWRKFCDFALTATNYFRFDSCLAIVIVQVRSHAVLGFWDLTLAKIRVGWNRKVFWFKDLRWHFCVGKPFSWTLYGLSIEFLHHDIVSPHSKC